MELVFENTKMQCLKQISCQLKDLELTQEVKLSEGMPDVGNILGAWGQVLIRGKEWRSNSVVVNGGVMCWAMYMPEEEKQPQMVEGWIPFQTQMDIPETTRDGHICVIPTLRYIDARSVSAGKLMIRACVGMQVRADISEQVQYYTPPEMPAHIQLLQNSYRLQIPCEAGEKTFVMDEEFSVDGPAPEKLLHYRLQPTITQIKVMVGKVVFRGSALVQGLYMGENGIHSFQMDIPFAQYAQLEGEFDPEATAWVYPAVTSLELELSGGNNLHMKAGLTGQYVICDQKDIMLVEDAYSTTHSLQITSQDIDLPRVLENKEQQLRADFSPKESGRVVDVAFYTDQPRTQPNAQGLEHQLSGRYQLLFYGADNTICSENGKWEQTIRETADEKTKCQISLYPIAFPTADGVDVMCQCILTASEGIQTVGSLSVSDGQMNLQERPSLILRRKGDDSLWQIAKQTGSTIEQIKAANALDAEPAADKMLLIPT